jgi:hypothetical protein
MTDFDKLAEMIADNHVETVQRLTRLETQLDGIPARVTDLEHFKYKILGISTGISTMAAMAVAWLKRN